MFNYCQLDGLIVLLDRKFVNTHAKEYMYGKRTHSSVRQVNLLISTQNWETCVARRKIKCYNTLWLM